MTTNSPGLDAEANEPTDFYELLQVSPKADPEIIEATYRRLALRYHPDHNPLPDATERMKALNAAYATLKDPQRRADYDRRLCDPGYIGDFSEDDYEPPLRSALRWRPNLPGMGRTGWLGWLAVLLLVGMIGFLWLSQNGSSQAAETLPVSPGLVSPTSLPEGVLFADDFESVGSANWTLETPWHLTSRFSSSSSHSLWMGDEGRGRYNPNLSAAATLARPLDLTKTARPILRFRLAGQSDHDQNPTGEDRLFVEVAEPGRDFQTVFTANGLYPTWQEISLDLSRWKGRQLLVRFRFSSGSLNSGAGFSGFFVDDLKVTK